MNLRDLRPNQLKHLAQEGDDDYDRWMRTTGGTTFGTKLPIPQKDVWRLAFSKGAAAVLRRVDKLKEQ